MSGELQGLNEFIGQNAPDATPSEVGAPPGLDDFVNDQKHGGLGQQLLAGEEALERGLSLGLSDVARTKLDPNLIPPSLQSTPEGIKGRMEANPVTNFVGQGVGGAALGATTGGMGMGAAGAGLAKAVGAPAVLGTIGAMGGEGAIFGGSNAVTDYALGDPNLNAQKILTYIGLGGLTGLSLGALSSAVGAAPALFRSSGALEDATSRTAPNVAGSIVDSAEKITGKAPQSIDEMADRVSQARADGATTELPQKAVLQDALSRVDLDNPVNLLQLNSLDDQGTRDVYKAAMEMPGKTGDTLRSYEGIQKNELVNKLGSSIEDLSPEIKPTSDAIEGGKRAIDAFIDQYQTEKEALKPVFEALKNTEIGGNVDHLPGVVNAMTDAVPGVARMFNTEAGHFEVLPYKTNWGIDKSTYTAVKDAVEALKANPESFEDLANIRGGLDQNINILDQGKGPAQIRALKASMMDYMQKVLDDQNHSFEVRNAFKDYAINEQQRGVIEKTFGASVGNPEFGAISKVKPESILDKMFANTANVEAAQKILEPAKFSEALANWVSQAKEAATDKGAFSSNKFGRWLKNNESALSVAFKDNPAQLQRLKDLTTVMRILPDSASINPSGSAKTLLHHISSLGEFLMHPEAIPGKVIKGIPELIEKRGIQNEVNAQLAGKADQAARLQAVRSVVNKVDMSMGAAAKNIFVSGGSKAAADEGFKRVAEKDHDDTQAKIKELASNPNLLMDQLSKSTEALYGAAPNITQGIHNTMMAAISFLSSKIPTAQDHLYLSEDYKSSKAEIQKFGNYVQAITKPAVAFAQIKGGTLTQDTMDAIQAVHPQLLAEMRQKVMASMTPEKVKSLPYGARLSLSKFLGVPLSPGMTPQSVLSNQNTLSAPSVSQQGKKTSSLGGLKQLKIASRAGTETTREDQGD